MQDIGDQTAGITRDSVRGLIRGTGTSTTAFAEWVGMDRRTLQRRLAGTTPFTVTEVERISAATGVPAHRLVGP